MNIVLLLVLFTHVTNLSIYLLAAPGSPSKFQAKVERKRAEEDADLLEHRLEHLRIEEEKARLKAEATKKKVDEVQRLKREREEMLRAKEERV